MTEPNPPQKQPNEPASLGKRTLAAIMFTDAVAFSKLASENEEHALRVTARDLAAIADIVGRFEGRVLKRTGDGLLAFFTSGVQAVACALEIQHTMAEQAKMLPPSEVLQHRIGIHLGDVFLQQNEVMGDGVNVAARLQSEAPPGGICITQALYEIAKNRLSLHTVHLGARQLKNIRESVQVYQVLTEADLSRPLGASAPHAASGGPLVVAPQEPRPAPAASSAAPHAARKPWSRRAVALVVGGAALLAILAVVLSLWVFLGSSPPAPASDTSLLDAAVRKEYGDARKRYLAARDYEGLAGWIHERALDGPDGALRTDYIKYTRLGVFLGWLDGELRAFRASEPLVVKGRGGTFRLFGSNGKVVLRAPNVERTFNLRTERAPLVLLAAGTIARERWRGQTIDADDPRARLIEGMHLFAREERLRADELLAGLKRPEDLVPADLGDDLFDPFVLFDRDGNGKLMPEELPPPLRLRLKGADADNDGAITRAEYVGSRRRSAPAP